MVAERRRHDVTPLDERRCRGTRRARRGRGRRPRGAVRGGRRRRGGTARRASAYVCTSVNVGDVIGSSTPSALPKPWANAVLPAPISPARTTMSPARQHAATAAATAWVAASDGATRETGDSSEALDATGDQTAAADVAARDPRADAAHDLVADRAERRRPLLGADLLVPWRPMSTTSSPTATSSSPQSTINWSIVIVPMICDGAAADQHGRRRCPTGSRRTPSA